MLTQSRLKELLHYDQITGQFTWSTMLRRSGVTAGARAGNVMKKGYLRISIDGQSYQANRLAWLYMTGAWPKNDVDHKNNQTADNAWNNLRDVPRVINLQNSITPRSDSTTQLRGVSKNKKRFAAKIQADGVGKYLGTFDTPQQAHAAYIKAKVELHTGWIR